MYWTRIGLVTLYSVPVTLIIGMFDDVADITAKLSAFKTDE